MSKKLIALSITALVLAVGFLALTFVIQSAASQNNIVQAQAAVQEGGMTSEEMQSAIEELRMLIQILVLGMSNNTATQTQQPGIPQMSSRQAREIALDVVGAGETGGVMLFTEDGVLTFEVEVTTSYGRYVVYINAITRDVIRMQGFASEGSQVAPPATPAPTPAPTTPAASNITIGNVTPRPPARSGGPSNPPISAQRAVELARDHLISIGVTSARFDYVYMDQERGIWVWSVEFDGQGRSFEFYVNVNDGSFLKAPQTSGAASSPTPSPTASPTATARPTASPAATASPSPTASPSGNRNNRPQNPNISLERAIEIAYADLAARNISAAFRRDSGMDWERNQWVWELEFRPNGGRGVIEYYINVDNGNIVKFEWDR